MKKYSVVFLSPGPIYDLDSSSVQSKYIALSPFLRGHFLTTANSEETIKMGEFECHTMARRKFINISFLMFCLVWAFKVRRKEKVDFIITYDPLKTGLIGCLLKLVLGAKLIVEVNGVYTSPVVWEDHRNFLMKHIKKYLVPKQMKLVFRFSDGIKLQFATQINQFYEIPKGTVTSIFSSWIPTSNFSNLGEKKEILLVGFPFKIKGVDILIKAFRQIAEQFPEWRLKILGWYPDMGELSAAIGDHPQILHHPPVPSSEVSQHIGECGIFVLPSRTDAKPRVLIESAAAGKPRIGTNVDGIPMLIEDGIDGFLVDTENVEQLAEKMAQLMRDPILRKKIGAAAKKRVEVEFTEKKYVENLLCFIENVDLR